VAGAGVAWKAVAWYVLEVAPTVWPVWFGLPAKLDVFAMGMLLAVVVASGDVTVGRTGALLLRLSGLAVVGYAFATRPYDDGPHVWFHTVAALGFVLVLAGSVLGPGTAGCGPCPPPSRCSSG
jgi:peptidoglycan/LPS O-acetylase OafA/YrhL